MVDENTVLEGTVVKGDGISGRDYNLPTANIHFSDELDVESGVYAAVVEHDDEEYESIVCYGAGDPPKFEAHMFGFYGDLVGQMLRISLVEKVSEIIPWQSKERMRQKIIHDIELVYNVLQKNK